MTNLTVGSSRAKGGPLAAAWSYSNELRRILPPSAITLESTSTYLFIRRRNAANYQLRAGQEQRIEPENIAKEVKTHASLSFGAIATRLPRSHAASHLPGGTSPAARAKKSPSRTSTRAMAPPGLSTAPAHCSKRDAVADSGGPEAGAAGTFWNPRIFPGVSASCSSATPTASTPITWSTLDWEARNSRSRVFPLLMGVLSGRPGQPHPEHHETKLDEKNGAHLLELAIQAWWGLDNQSGTRTLLAGIIFPICALSEGWVAFL